MSWGIRDEEFERIGMLLKSERNETDEGSVGTVLFYGFGDDGSGRADSVLSGRLSWEYASARLKSRVWQSPYINFDKPDAFRLRPGAPPRPRGFYLGDVRIEGKPPGVTVSQSRRHFYSVTGLGPEGFQILCITHTNLPDLMSERKIPFMALADYDVAPYGFNDFIDVPQIFCSNGILGLGIGNADHEYQGFAIPVVVNLRGSI
jgi:hypothetical protein